MSLLAHVYAHASTHVHAHFCAHAHAHVRTHVYAHAYTYFYEHSHVRTHVLTQGEPSFSIWAPTGGWAGYRQNNCRQVCPAEKSFGPTGSVVMTQMLEANIKMCMDMCVGMCVGMCTDMCMD